MYLIWILTRSNLQFYSKAFILIDLLLTTLNWFLQNNIVMFGNESLQDNCYDYNFINATVVVSKAIWNTKISLLLSQCDNITPSNAPKGVLQWPLCFQWFHVSLLLLYRCIAFLVFPGVFNIATHSSGNHDHHHLKIISIIIIGLHSKEKAP